MSDEYDVYIEQAGFSLDLEIETGVAGTPGIQGPVGPPITVREIDGSPTVAATELVFPNGTLTVAGSVATVANLATLGANVFSAKQSFSGTNHAGLCLNSLTTAEYNALTPANGDLFRDATADRIDARLNRGTVELIDSAGGQTIGGTLTVNGNLNAASAFFQLSNRAMFTATASSIVRITDAAAAAGFSIDCATDNQMTLRNRANSAAGNLNVGNLTASGTVQFGSTVYRTDGLTGLGTSSVANVWLALNGTQIFGSGNVNEVVVRQASALGFSNAVGNVTSGYDVNISRSSAGVLRIGTTAPGNSGSLVCAQVTSNLRTNTIVRDVGDATLAIYNANMGVGAHCVTIPGSSGALTNSTGVAGELRINSIINQTGTAGSTNLDMVRTETALGSGSHNFIRCVTNSVFAFAVDRVGNVSSAGTITGGLASTPVTFSVLNASSATATLGLRRITDRSNRLAYPDGTNWRFVSDDAIIS